MDSPLENRLVSSSANRETYGVPQAASGGGGGRSQRPTLNDAVLFLNDVKATFQDRREKFAELLQIINEFGTKRINTAGVVARVKDLLKEHPELISRFNLFLPKRYEISLPLENEHFFPKKTVEFVDAIAFVNKIKTRFQDNDHVYKSFLDNLNMYRSGIKSITEVYQAVADLFNDHRDLIEEFNHFLPGTAITATEKQERISHIRADRDHSVRRARISHIRKLKRKYCSSEDSASQVENVG